jgi:hypothetical protein
VKILLLFLILFPILDLYSQSCLENYELSFQYPKGIGNAELSVQSTVVKNHYKIMIQNLKKPMEWKRFSLKNDYLDSLYFYDVGLRYYENQQMKNLAFRDLEKVWRLTDFAYSDIFPNYISKGWELISESKRNLFEVGDSERISYKKGGIESAHKIVIYCPANEMYPKSIDFYNENGVIYRTLYIKKGELPIYIGSESKKIPFPIELESHDLNTGRKSKLKFVSWIEKP